MPPLPSSEPSVSESEPTPVERQLSVLLGGHSSDTTDAPLPTDPTVTSFHLNVPKPRSSSEAVQPHSGTAEDDKEVNTSSFTLTQTKLDWKSVLTAVFAACPNLRQLTVSCFFDCSGKSGLSIATLTWMLAQGPQLESLTLDSVGLYSGNVQSDFFELETVCRQHASLHKLEFHNTFFVPVQRTTESWLKCTQLLQACRQLPALRQLTLAATHRFFSRPHWTVQGLQDLLEHCPQLQSLTLENVVVWGAGSGAAVAKALRQHEHLEALALRSCILAADAPLLAGLDHNNSMTNLDLHDSDLSLEVAGLVTALEQNATLESCNLSRTRLGGDEKTHHVQLCRLMTALQSHPTLVELHVRDQHSYQYDDGTLPTPYIGQALQALVRALQQNRVLQHIHLDDSVCQTTGHDDVQFYLGLNRCGYHDLSQAESGYHEWTDSMAVVTQQVACLFHLLRDNPLLCGSP